MKRTTRAGLLALVCAAATIWLLPAASVGRGADIDGVLNATNDRLGKAIEQAVAPVADALRSTTAKTKSALDKTRSGAAQAGERATRATATDPARQPPMHGTNPHGQGGVAVVDLTPSNERPLGGNPDGSDSGEEVVVGRARGEQTAGGAYHGHITILSLFGSELAGVDSAEGETKNGPLQPLQSGVLDPLCTSTNNQVCLSVLTADSTTTAAGSSNDFAIARASVIGLGVGAAESGGTIGETANCQNAVGSGKTANVTTSGGQVAGVANASATSQSCRNQTPATQSSSQVISLGGTGIPLPAAGCANGTPDTVVEVPLVAKIVCNADEVTGASAVRAALDVFAVNVGGNSLVKETTAATEATTVAPAGAETTGAQCSDGVDNDGDGVIDAADPGCHSDGNANNPSSYNPNDTSEADATSPTAGSGGESGTPQCSDNRDNDGDGRVDEADPGCHSDGNPNNPSSYNPRDDDESDGGGGSGSGSGSGTPECSDDRDNDGDGVIDSADPDCHSDGDASNPASFDPNDDSEGDGSGGLNTSSLPLTGSNIVGLALAGLLMLAGGLLLRRREEARASA